MVVNIFRFKSQITKAQMSKPLTVGGKQDRVESEVFFLKTEYILLHTLAITYHVSVRSTYS